VAENIKFNKNKVIAEIIQILFRHTLPVLKICSIRKMSLRLLISVLAVLSE